jgi:hypothetical protein
MSTDMFLRDAGSTVTVTNGWLSRAMLSHLFGGARPL